MAERSEVEEWRPVPDYPDYEVSSLGRARHGARILKPYTTQRTGYMRITVYHNGNKSSMRAILLHLAVIRAFRGPAPAGCEANHEDGVKANCALSNLVYMTPKKNVEHAYRLGLRNREAHDALGRFTRQPAALLTQSP